MYNFLKTSFCMFYTTLHFAKKWLSDQLNKNEMFPLYLQQRKQSCLQWNSFHGQCCEPYWLKNVFSCEVCLPFSGRCLINDSEMCFTQRPIWTSLMNRMYFTSAIIKSLISVHRSDSFSFCHSSLVMSAWKSQRSLFWQARYPDLIELSGTKRQRFGNLLPFCS